MSPEFIFFALSKTQILEFLGLAISTKIAKDKLIEQLLRRIEADANEKARLLETFLYELAVEPAELEKLLQCTPTERKRWVKEGKVPVLEYRTFRRSGSDLEYAVHDRRDVLKISKDAIQQWRDAHLIEVRARQQAGRQIAVENRRANLQARQQFVLSWQQTIDEWKQAGSAELVLVLMLAYWTLWASRWAKENQMKALRSRKNTAQYIARRDEWYERKNQAMLLLAKTPYARLSFYRPSNPDKEHLWLCEEHYEEKCERYYNDVWEFYYHNSAVVKNCSQCIVSQEKDYYALYYLQIMTETFPDLRFSFHMPYPIGRAWLPEPRRLPHVEHTEQDGLFRFGRPLVANEKVIYREQDVQEHFEQALAEARQFFAPDETRDREAVIQQRTGSLVVNSDDALQSPDVV